MGRFPIRPCIWEKLLTFPSNVLAIYYKPDVFIPILEIGSDFLQIYNEIRKSQVNVSLILY